MKVCVLQLCRMGDVVQTLPLLAALKQGGVEVDLVIHEAYRGLPVSSSVVDAIHFVPRGSIDEPTDELAQLLRFSQALSDWLESLRQRSYDVVINLSHDKASGLIAYYLKPKEIQGLSFRRDRTEHVRHPWIHYSFSLMEARGLGVFNLAEIYGLVAGVRLTKAPSVLDLDSSLRHKARCALGRRGATSRGRVGLVPGASDSRKQWPPGSFARVGEALGKSGFDVVVLGTSAEKRLAEIICEASDPPPINLAGATDLEVLAAVLGELDLVITNDTGSMHLAAAAGTKTLVCTSGPAYFQESAPFGEGHLVLQPQLACCPCQFTSTCLDPICKHVVQPSQVTAWALELLRGLTPTARPAPGLRAFYTRIDDEGCLRYEPLHTYRLEIGDLVREVYRGLWEVSLGARTNPPNARDLIGTLRGRWDLSSIQSLVDEAEGIARAAANLSAELKSGCSSVLEFCRGARGTGKPASEMSTLVELAERLDLAGAVNPWIRPLASFTRVQLQFVGARSPSSAMTDVLSALSGGADRARMLHSQMVECARALGALQSDDDCQRRNSCTMTSAR